MSKRNVPDLTHLRGADLERVAKSLTAGTVEAVLADKESIINLKADELKKLSEILAVSPVAHCGGFGCG